MTDENEIQGGKEQAAREVLRLLKAAKTGSLASSLTGDGSGWPYVSLVLVAPGEGLEPLLLLSELAEHTRNLKADHRAALLLRATNAKGDPLAESRVTLLGRVAPAPEERREEAMAAYLARHPRASLYAGFADFRLYRLSVERAHLVAGFGRIHWLEKDELEAAADEPIPHGSTQIE